MKRTAHRWFRHRYHQQTVLRSTPTTGVWWLPPAAWRRSQSGLKTFKQPYLLLLHPVLMMLLPIHGYCIQASSQTVCYSGYLLIHTIAAFVWESGQRSVCVKAIAVQQCVTFIYHHASGSGCLSASVLIMFSCRQLFQWLFSKFA